VRKHVSFCSRLLEACPPADTRQDAQRVYSRAGGFIQTKSPAAIPKTQEDSFPDSADRISNGWKIFGVPKHSEQS